MEEKEKKMKTKNWSRGRSEEEEEGGMGVDEHPLTREEEEGREVKRMTIIF